MGREAFLEQVWAWKNQYEARIVSQVQRMGNSCDWDRLRFTMDEGLSRSVRAAFVHLYEKGLIYRGKYIVNWCPKDRTALSDDEVETKDGGEPGHLWHMRYPLADGTFLVVATTRPETMLGDTAVAVNPKDERYTHLVGKKIKLPLTDREIPVIADDFVEMDFGTGCVKVTPAHDLNDFGVFQRHPEIGCIDIMNEDASLNDQVPERFRGLDRFEARKRIVAEFEELGLLEKIEDRMTPIGRSYRSGEPIEYRLSDQWFVDLKPLAEKALASNREGRVRFVPERWNDYYCKWLENVRPLVHQPPAVVGPSHPRVVRRRRRGPARRWKNPRCIPRRARRSCARTTTCWTPGSRRDCGRSPRWAGPDTRPRPANRSTAGPNPTSRGTTPPTSWSPTAASSSSGWRAWS